MPILFPHPLDQQFLTEGLCYSYSIDLRYAAMFRNLDKEIVFGRTLVERLIRHVMRTYLDSGFVSTSREWIRNQLEMVEFTTPID